MRRIVITWLFVAALVSGLYAQSGEVNLIAHRGGVVDEYTDENSVAAVRKAADQGYYMVELDVRLTKDSVLVVHHDRDLVRFFNVDKKLNDLFWEEVSVYETANGHRMQKLEAMLQLCRKEGLQVMIDFKIEGKQPAVFEEVYSLLKTYELDTEALIIPSEKATDYFRGRIKLSCTRAQVEAYQKRNDYSAAHYYLFTNPSVEDYQWAVRNNIQVVGAINYQKGIEEGYEELASELKDLGVKYVQLDSQFARFFK
ncbi:glycerophosphodiester phosphodiesterase family protein [Sphingobacterium sp. UT-1RO-CII-1]|uniref:glycerophosphodiester phosphodiesterase n=1 Tax=Sphingobacterium sp. UT-1RO-CII-1 TaxID=2995225 RepID=UPI00227B6FCA|nr:glycerophosphodiester phosphodiesterase family protein [Sphingobacterium sp. UT-1RO-CII-1]MCY4779351.1 glycerophosphodiester phosphodiesterase family protein [Sphingobacterium sp. UT-1RO-CII-1]